MHYWALAGQLYNRVTEPACTFQFMNAVVHGPELTIEVDGTFVRESLYLVRDMERRFRGAQENVIQNLDAGTVWIIASSYAGMHNYWHWIAQVLPAVMQARTAVNESRVKVGFLTCPLNDWQRDSLRALGIEDDQVIEIRPGVAYAARTVLYSDILGSRHVFANIEPRDMVRRAVLKASDASVGGRERLYVSRADSSARPMLNEAEVVEALTARGFSVVQNSSLSFRDQVQLYSRAAVVVAGHGAGSANTLFMAHGMRYVEMLQASHLNVGPLSLGKISKLRSYVDVYEDDGLGQRTSGWYASGQVLGSTLNRVLP